MFKTITLSCCVIVIATGVSFGQPDGLVEQAIELTKARFRPPSMQVRAVVEREQQYEAARSFSEILDEMGRGISARRMDELKLAEGQDIASKLFLIAADRRGRPEVYEEIEQEYVKKVHSEMSRLPASPRVKPQHAVEKYRLAWEYYLLSPSPEGAVALYGFRPYDALQRIRNNASLVTLVHCYRTACQENVKSMRRVRTDHRQVLSTINTLCNEDALRAMLECLALSVEQKSKIDSEKEMWDVEEYVYDMLSDPLKSSCGEKWGKVIESFPRTGLTAEGARLLDRVTQGE